MNKLCIICSRWRLNCSETSLRHLVVKCSLQVYKSHQYLLFYRNGTINNKNWGPLRRTLFPASYGYMTTTQIKGCFVKEYFSEVVGHVATCSLKTWETGQKIKKLAHYIYNFVPHYLILMWHTIKLHELCPRS